MYKFIIFLSAFTFFLTTPAHTFFKKTPPPLFKGISLSFNGKDIPITPTTSCFKEKWGNDEELACECCLRKASMMREDGAICAQTFCKHRLIPQQSVDSPEPASLFQAPERAPEIARVEPLNKIAFKSFESRLFGPNRLVLMEPDGSINFPEIRQNIPPSLRYGLMIQELKKSLRSMLWTNDEINNFLGSQPSNDIQEKALRKKFLLTHPYLPGIFMSHSHENFLPPLTNTRTDQLEHCFFPEELYSRLKSWLQCKYFRSYKVEKQYGYHVNKDVFTVTLDSNGAKGFLSDPISLSEVEKTLSVLKVDPYKRGAGQFFVIPVFFNLQHTQAFFIIYCDGATTTILDLQPYEQEYNSARQSLKNLVGQDYRDVTIQPLPSPLIKKCGRSTNLPLLVGALITFMFEGIKNVQQIPPPLIAERMVTFFEQTHQPCSRPSLTRSSGSFQNT